MSTEIKFSHTFFTDVENNKNSLAVLLFLHGFMGNKKDWVQISKLLGDKYNCMAIDLPGHGATVVTGGDKCYSIEETSSQIAKFVKLNFQKKISLVGYSMGGRLAWNLICNYPDLFEKAVIESSTPGITDLTEREKRAQRDNQLAEKIRSEPLVEFIDFWYDLPLFASLKNNQDNLKKLKEKRLSNKRELLAKSISLGSPGRTTSLWEELKNIDIPIHLIVGEKDDKFQKINLEIKSKLKNCSMTVVQNAGHNVHFQEPEQFAAIIKSFISQ